LMLEEVRFSRIASCGAGDMVSQGPGVRAHLLRFNLMQDVRRQEQDEYSQYHWTYRALRAFAFKFSAAVFWASVVYLALVNAI
jgi:hypothetical protein